MDFWDRLSAAAQRNDILRHPFYVRWSEGKLTRDELALYAGQYAHAVRALAGASRHAANTARGDMAAELTGHASEEEAHVDLWSRFATAVGGNPSHAALEETAECTSAWSDADRELLPTLVALYAIESAQPAISETKRAGLAAHYGMPSGPGTEYFDVHAVRDHEHAASGREMIERLLDDEDGVDHDALVAEAERVLAANWRLLDGVDRAIGA
jgi:pyrroloquinoline-quinone synthase